MRDIITHRQFERDVKLARKRGKDLKKLEKLVNMLLRQEKLPQKHRPHRLLGNYSDFYECHIEPDWLLIYQQQPDHLLLVRTGSHSDLF